jgi:hypothetical protein
VYLVRSEIRPEQSMCFSLVVVGYEDLALESFMFVPVFNVLGRVDKVTYGQ